MAVLFSVAWPIVAQATDCSRQGAPSWAMQHPSTLLNWMRGQGVRDIERFVCCLPPEYRSNYAVAHSSQAAQNGTPENPRVLMFNDVRDGAPMNMTLSINSGAPGMHQGNSIELAFRNPRNGALEYYDMNFEGGSPKLSGANPTSCTSCHGQYGGNFAHGGARPLFRIGNRWPNFVGGTSRCQTPEDSLFAQASQRAVRAIRTTPRFRCLDPQQLGSGKKGGGPSPILDGNDKLHSSLVRYSAALERANSERAAALVINQPSYRQFKYFILGYDMCSSVTQPTDWMPAQKIADLYARVKVLPQVRSARTAREAFNAGRARVRATVSNQQARLSRLSSADVLRNGYQPSVTTFSCSSGASGAERELLANDSALGRIAIDNRLRSDSEDFQMSAALRLFYEGTGGDITDLSMTPASESANHNSSTPIQGNLLFRDPELASLFVRRELGEASSGENRMIFTARDVVYTSKQSLASTCRILAQKSSAAFQAVPLSSRPATSRARQ